MMRAGWLQEVEKLATEYDFQLPAFCSVGYRELEQVVRKELTMDDAKAMVIARTRRYAKRQLTWFSHQGRWLWMSAQKGVTAKIASGLAAFAED
jgi:tRNA dimethylallyltransferase